MDGHNHFELSDFGKSKMADHDYVISADGSEADSEDPIESEGELLLQEKESPPSVPPTYIDRSTMEKIKACLAETNWKNIAASTCLCLAVLTCNAAFSLMGPFFPQEVITISVQLVGL